MYRAGVGRCWFCCKCPPPWWTGAVSRIPYTCVPDTYAHPLLPPEFDDQNNLMVQNYEWLWSVPPHLLAIASYRPTATRINRKPKSNASRTEAVMCIPLLGVCRSLQLCRQLDPCSAHACITASPRLGTSCPSRMDMCDDMYGLIRITGKWARQ